MRNEIVKIKELLPAQPILSEVRVFYLVREFQSDLVEKISVVHYNRHFIINNGHHRSAVLDYFGKEEVEAEILEDDLDIRKCRDGIIPFVRERYFQGVLTFENFISFYVSNLASMCVAKGITKIRDYNVRELVEKQGQLNLNLGI